MSYSDNESSYDYSDEEGEDVCVCNNRYECQCIDLIINKRRIRVTPTDTKPKTPKKPPTKKPVTFSSSTRGWGIPKQKPISALSHLKKEDEKFSRTLTSIMHQTNELVGTTSRYLMCNSVIRGLKCDQPNCSFAHTYDSIIPVTCKKDCIKDSCVFIHSYETHEQFYKRLRKLHKEQREHFVINRSYVMCKQLMEYGKCSNRLNCKFAHTSQELYPKICKFRGKCNRFKTCPFLHPNETKEDLINRLGLSFKKPQSIKKAPSKMCRAYLKNKNKKDCARYSKGKCSFAHDFSELIPNKCRTKTCKKPTCPYIHPFENREQFRKRLNY